MRPTSSRDQRREVFAAARRRGPGGLTELTCHPGPCGSGFPSSYAAEREVELRNLVRPQTASGLAEAGIPAVGPRQHLRGRLRPPYAGSGGFGPVIPALRWCVILGYKGRQLSRWRRVTSGCTCSTPGLRRSAAICNWLERDVTHISSGSAHESPSPLESLRADAPIRDEGKTLLTADRGRAGRWESRSRSSVPGMPRGGVQDACCDGPDLC